jgi:EAL domain-containing protein (putative c-di-GMP-specific phosphodiesterase class I)
MLPLSPGTKRAARSRPLVPTTRTGTDSLRFKATAVRPPAQASAQSGATSSAVAASASSVESLGQQLREVLPSRRLHSVSLCDHEANVLWLSEGALGPDEHTVVVEALEALAGDPALPCHEAGLEDGRLAVFLPVRAPTGALVGIAMILADSKSVGDDTLERLTAAPVRTIMQRLAVLLKPTAPGATARNPIPIELVLEPEASESPPPQAPPEPAAAPRSIATAPAARPAHPRPVPVQSAPPRPAVAPPPVMSPEEINDILEFELTPQEALTTSVATLNLESDDLPAMASLEFLPEPPVVGPAPPPAPVVRKARVLDPPAPTRASAEAKPAPARPTPAARPPTSGTEPRVQAAAPPARPAARASAVVAPPPAPAAVVDGPMLELVPFAKLRAGGQSRRFQVQAHAPQLPRDPAARDALVLQRLLGWLAQHRASWNAQPTSFTVNLSIATLEDERFTQRLAAQLNTHGLAAETLGFEITEALCTQHRAPVERFIAQCEKVGAWVVIDDFSFDSQVLPLLRCKALRLVKLDAKLSAAALRDKLSQALVVATVQAAKVLGIHCAAKKVDSKAALQWLTAIGCDFAQGSALGPVQSLESLAAAPTPPAQGG